MHCEVSDRMTPTHRHSYSAAFKRKVILYTESTNNLAAERHYGILEKCIRSWRQQEEKLFACAESQMCFRGPKEGKQPAIEESVEKWVIEQQDKEMSVSYKEDIQLKKGSRCRE